MVEIRRENNTTYFATAYVYGTRIQLIAIATLVPITIV